MRLHVQEHLVVGWVDLAVVSVEPLQVQLVPFLSIQLVQRLAHMLVVAFTQQSLVVSCLQLYPNEIVLLCRQEYNPWTSLDLVVLYIIALIQKVVFVFVFIDARQILLAHGRCDFSIHSLRSGRVGRVLAAEEVGLVHARLIRNFHVRLGDY